MTLRRLILSATLIAASLAVPHAQSQPDLEKRVAALEAMNRQVLQELQAIRSMLQGRGAPPQSAPQSAAGGPVSTGPDVDFMMSVAGRPMKGSLAAKVVIVEFSDFQCPFCGRYSRETYPQVIREFVDSGRAQYVFRHDPIPSLHPDAVNAAKAAECGFEQGKFWEVHDRLFNNQQRLQIDQLPTYGRGLGINDARFAKCINSDATQARVNSDKQESARVGVSGTPGFLIGQVLGNSQVRLLRRFKGAAPLTTFRAMIEAVEKAPRR